MLYNVHYETCLSFLGHLLFFSTSFSSLSQPPVSVINFRYSNKDQVFPFITSAIDCLVARYLENYPETQLFDGCVSPVETCFFFLCTEFLCLGFGTFEFCKLLKHRNGSCSLFQASDIYICYIIKKAFCFT